MKKFIALLVILLAIYFFFSSEPSSEKKPKAIPVFRIGSECDYVPNSWEENRSSEFNVPIANHEGSYADGYDIQIAKIIAGDSNKVLEVRKIAWNDLIPALNKGEIDAIFSSMLDTEERRKVVAFSDVYEVRKTEYAIIIDSVSPYITAKTLADFSGARIIGQKGTFFDDVIVQIPGAIHVDPAGNVQSMIDAVLQDEADGAVIDTETGHFYELTNKNLTLIRFTADGGFKLGFSGVCAAVKKGNSEILNRINIALRKTTSSDRQKIMDAVNSRMMKGLF